MAKNRPAAKEEQPTPRYTLKPGHNWWVGIFEKKMATHDRIMWAIDAFRSKYRRTPDYCMANPERCEEKTVAGVRIEEDEHLMLNWFALGFDDDEV